MRSREQLTGDEKSTIANLIARAEKIREDLPPLTPEEKQLRDGLLIEAPYRLEHDEAEVITLLYLKHIVGIDLPPRAQEYWVLPGWRDIVCKRLNGLTDEGKAPFNGIEF